METISGVDMSTDYDKTVSVVIPCYKVTRHIEEVILKIPKLGYIQDILASKGGLIIFVLIPCLAILSYDIMKIFKRLGQKTKLIKE